MKHDYSNLYRSSDFMQPLYAHDRDWSRRVEGCSICKAEVDSKKFVISFDAPANEKIIKDLLAEIDYPVEGLITL